MNTFSSLTEKLNNAFKSLRGKGALTEKDVDKALKEIKLAMLEADVNYKVVKKFISNIKEKAVGEDVLKSLTPGQSVINIVNEELKELLGGEFEGLKYKSLGATIIMMVGLQGAGKTTTCGKLAYLLKSQNRKPYLIAADIYRPGAIDQLEQIGKKVKTPVYKEDSKNVVEIVENGVKEAKEGNYDTIIIDTSGRMHLDEVLIKEVVDIKESVNPDEILLVVDGLTGQDAVNVGKEFHDKLDIDGVVLTKMDGDSRGGAAISLRSVADVPIKFLGTGEKVEQLEFFHPDRVASRILDMGDVLTLIEQAKDKIDEDEALELQKKMLKNEFTFNDFLKQIKQIRKLGSLKSIIGMLPGASKLKNVDIDDNQLVKIESIIFSMTDMERNNPSIIKSSRKVRIANGSGVSVAEVNRLLKQFEEMKKMMKQFSKKGNKGFGDFSNIF